MGLTGDAKRDYQRRYMERKRSNKGLTGSNKGIPDVMPPKDSNLVVDWNPDDVVPFVTPQRTKGKTPEECGYPAGQVDVRIGGQGQKLWRLNGHYTMPTRILCGKA